MIFKAKRGYYNWCCIRRHIPCTSYIVAVFGDLFPLRTRFACGANERMAVFSPRLFFSLAWSASFSLHDGCVHLLAHVQHACGLWPILEWKPPQVRGRRMDTGRNNAANQYPRRRQGTRCPFRNLLQALCEQEAQLLFDVAVWQCGG